MGLRPGVSCAICDGSMGQEVLSLERRVGHCTGSRCRRLGGYMDDLIDLSATREHHTRIVAGRDLCAKIPFRDRWPRATFVVDEHVLALQGDRVGAFISGLADKVQVIPLAAGENAKTLDGAFALLRDLTERRVTR